MKWRKKKHQGKKEEEEEEKNKKPSPSSSSPSSSSSFSLSHVLLPLSWISRLKHRTTTKPNSQVADPKPSSSAPPLPHPPDHLSFSPAVLDRMIADAPRRLSVGEEDGLLAQSRSSRANRLPRSARHYSTGDLDFRPPFSTSRSDFQFAEFQTLGHVIPFSRKSRGSPQTFEIPSETDRSEIDPSLIRRRRRRRRLQRAKTEGNPDLRSTPPPRLKPIETNVKRSDPDRTEEIRHRVDQTVNGRRSFSGKIRRRTGPKVRVFSPRPAAEMSRISAAERKRSEEEERGLESFAVVKSSCDTEKDFRESMVEMIWEKGIGRPEELESLLACYLSLNSDEHHDVIVKVFRQLWFDLNPDADRLRVLLL